MALKDWKKTENSKSYIKFYHKTKELIIRIDLFKPEKYGYTVNISDFREYTLEHKDFKTKSQALKYARSYMRKH